MGGFDIVIVGIDARRDALEVTHAVAELLGTSARDLAARLQVGTAFFAARNLGRTEAKQLLDALRAAGARAKPWQSGVPLPAEESVVSTAVPERSQSIAPSRPSAPRPDQRPRLGSPAPRISTMPEAPPSPRERAPGTVPSTSGAFVAVSALDDPFAVPGERPSSRPSPSGSTALSELDDPLGGAPAASPSEPPAALGVRAPSEPPAKTVRAWRSSDAPLAPPSGEPPGGRAAWDAALRASAGRTPNRSHISSLRLPAALDSSVKGTSGSGQGSPNG